MKRSLRTSIVIAALAGTSAAGIAWAQSDTQSHPGMQGGMGGHGMMGRSDQSGMRGMMGMMQGCPMMQGAGGSGGAHGGMPHLPPGNEKLELQMHADMMRAMSDILSKYAARLPDKK